MSEYENDKESKKLNEFKEYGEYNYFLKDNERLSYKQQGHNNKKKYRRFFYLGNVLLIVLIYFIIFRPAIDKVSNQSDTMIFTYESVDFRIKLFADKQYTVCDLFIKNNSDKSLLINKETLYVTVFDIQSQKIIRAESIMEKTSDISIFKSEQKHVLFYIEGLIKKFYITIIFKNKEIYQTQIIEKEKLMYEQK